MVKGHVARSERTAYKRGYEAAWRAANPEKALERHRKDWYNRKLRECSDVQA